MPDLKAGVSVRACTVRIGEQLPGAPGPAVLLAELTPGLAPSIGDAVLVGLLRRAHRLLRSGGVLLLATRQQHTDGAAGRRYRDAAGKVWNGYGLVFTTQLGTPIDPDNLGRSWYPLRKRAGLLCPFHDLRHTCVSLLLDLGVSPHTVRTIAGHKAGGRRPAVDAVAAKRPGCP
ncbi:hypothetical protein BIV57_15970 [Mangrovactinospora gilvigrisea]|uniref:Tyr recombinase domain-containing protein n=1 Tax=Mangrovactinospora gilvigrisea TaxID=1428644 RepID=A0A1J7C4K8_9ACTN|nr:tyrosine-type recombinase/integrase [Mangrovactinospora gilvigrisea]OIV36496.1 hypothetical protein BIV57_15970 [Mangrovactinospora gilvigrisea]